MQAFSILNWMVLMAWCINGIMGSAHALMSRYNSVLQPLESPLSLFIAGSVSEKEYFTYGHTVFYQWSRSENSLAPSFFPSQQGLVVNNEGKGDVDPSWVGVYPTAGTAYTSNLTFIPERRVLGCILHARYQAPLLFKGVFLQARMPFMHITHELQVKESVQKESIVTGGEEAVLPFLKDDEGLSFGRIVSNKQTITGVSDSALSLGYCRNGYSYSACAQIGIKVGLANAGNGKTVFEPLLSTRPGLHWYTTFEGTQKLFKTASNIDFFVKGGVTHESNITPSLHYRTYDKKGQPFSRFLYYKDTEQGNYGYVDKSSNGVNFFTLPTEIRSNRGEISGAVEALYFHHRFSAGVRYEWQGAEKIEKVIWPKRTFSIPAPITGANRWMPAAHIATPFLLHDGGSKMLPGHPPSDTPALLKEFDCDKASATMPARHSWIGHMSYQYAFTTSFIQGQIILGGSYEFLGGGPVLPMTSIWMKIAFTC